VLRSGGGTARVRWGAPESSTASRSSSGQFEIVSEAWIGVLRHGMGAREGKDAPVQEAILRDGIDGLDC
jgi:hypothetical protein